MRRQAPGRPSLCDWRKSRAWARLDAVGAALLNERQSAYLLATYSEDPAREALHRGPGGPPAGRWIEYGPVGVRWLDGPGSRLL